MSTDVFKLIKIQEIHYQLCIRKWTFMILYLLKGIRTICYIMPCKVMVVLTISYHGPVLIPPTSGGVVSTKNSDDVISQAPDLSVPRIQSNMSTLCLIGCSSASSITGLICQVML